MGSIVKLPGKAIYPEWGGMTGNISDQTDLVQYIEENGGNIETPTEQELQDLYKTSNIVCWGDSLTEGYPAFPYPSELSRLVKCNIFNRGISGQLSAQIRDRFLAEPNLHQFPTIIWAGNNDITNIAPVPGNIATMVSQFGHTNYLVLGVVFGDYANRYNGTPLRNTCNAMNNSLAATYGSRYIDIHSYLMSLAEPSDATDVTNGVIPASLRTDLVHLNKKGYDAVANHIFNSYIDLLTPIVNKYPNATQVSEYFKGGMSGVFKNYLAVENMTGSRVIEVDGETGMTKIAKVSALPTLQSEVVVNSNFANGLTNWSATGWVDGGGKATHNSGISSLSQTVNVTVGAMYLLQVDVIDRTLGSFEILIDGVAKLINGTQSTTVMSANGTVYCGYYRATISGSILIEIKPTSNFNGSVSLVSLKRVNELKDGYMLVGGNRYSRLVGSNLAIGGNAFKWLSPSSDNNLGIGDCFEYLNRGGSNTVVGITSFPALVNGSNNVGVGAFVGRYLTDGHKNVFIGGRTAFSHRVGNNNIAVGYNTISRTIGGDFNLIIGNHAAEGYSNDMTLSGNTIIGNSSASMIRTGSINNTILGYNSGVNLEGNNNIIIGSGINIPSAGNNNVNIGNVIQGINVSSQVSSAPAGQIGIAVAAKPTATLTLAASTALRVPLNLVPGTNPTSPDEGDVWIDNTTSEIKIRIGGVTKVFNLT